MYSDLATHHVRRRRARVVERLFLNSILLTLVFGATALFGMVLFENVATEGASVLAQIRTPGQ